jgi:hypothetical protein
MNREKLDALLEALKVWEGIQNDPAVTSLNMDEPKRFLVQAAYDEYRDLLLESGHELIKAADELLKLKDTLFPKPEFRDDWDTLRGIERIEAPLPKGCHCTGTALMMVVTCPVHVCYARSPWRE